jgi:hypothetical protein
MKRSEMLKLLEEETKNWMTNPPDRIELNLILITLEQAGMVPPEIQSNIYLRSECDYAWVNEWEPEETNDE